MLDRIQGIMLKLFETCSIGQLVESSTYPNRTLGCPLVIACWKLKKKCFF